MIIINNKIKMDIQDIIYRVPIELVYHIMEFLSYEEVCYIMHNSSTLIKYLSNLNMTKRHPKYYTRDNSITTYAKYNKPLYKYIISHLIKMPFPYTQNNHILFSNEDNIFTYDNVYNMTIYIIELNDINMLEFYLNNTLQYILENNSNVFNILFDKCTITKGLIRIQQWSL